MPPTVHANFSVQWCFALLGFAFFDQWDNDYIFLKHESRVLSVQRTEWDKGHQSTTGATGMHALAIAHTLFLTDVTLSPNCSTPNVLLVHAQELPRPAQLAIARDRASTSAAMWAQSRVQVLPPSHKRR